MLTLAYLTIKIIISFAAFDPLFSSQIALIFICFTTECVNYTSQREHWNLEYIFKKNAKCRFFSNRSVERIVNFILFAVFELFLEIFLAQNIRSFEQFHFEFYFERVSKLLIVSFRLFPFVLAQQSHFHNRFVQLLSLTIVFCDCYRTNMKPGAFQFTRFFPGRIVYSHASNGFFVHI